MASLNTTPDDPLVVIVGQTATGKSDLAIEIATKYNGEIICADSRTIYKGMDIGTAKPDAADRARVKHHIIDIKEPSETYSASEFKKDALHSLNDIYSRNKLPVLVGGTGLYIYSVIYDFDFGRPPDSKLRKKLHDLDIHSLQKKVMELNLGEKQINYKNKRHLIRAIENQGIVRSKKSLRNNTTVIGIKIDDSILKQRIQERNQNMLDAGLEDEVKSLVARYGWHSPGLNSIAYKEWHGYLEGEEDILQVRENMFKNNWQYARRQKIWFKRNEDIYWSTSYKDLVRQVGQFLIQY